MEAKETRMNPAMILCSKAKYESEYVWDEKGYLKQWIIDLLDEQSERSFKAGIKEAAKEIEGSSNFRVDSIWWKTKLKEWGIED